VLTWTVCAALLWAGPPPHAPAHLGCQLGAPNVAAREQQPRSCVLRPRTGAAEARDALQQQMHHCGRRRWRLLLRAPQQALEHVGHHARRVPNLLTAAAQLLHAHAKVGGRAEELGGGSEERRGSGQAAARKHGSTQEFSYGVKGCRAWWWWLRHGCCGMAAPPPPPQQTAQMISPHARACRPEKQCKAANGGGWWCLRAGHQCATGVG
jgi:hypothetical protein